MPYRSFRIGDIVILPFPPNDLVFGAYAKELVRQQPEPDPAALETALRTIYPRAVVRERAPLASVDGGAWYAYRDGRYSPFVEAQWWHEPSTALVILGADGRYLDANEPALRLLNTTLDDVRASRAGSFTSPGYRAMVPWLLQLLEDTGELHSTSVLLPRNGEPMPVEFHLVRDGEGSGRTQSWFRPVPLEAIVVVDPPNQPDSATR